MPTEIETKALEALARAYDREEAAQMGEPSPWQQDDLDPAWVAERIACAEVGVEAYREARAALAGEKPVGAGVETALRQFIYETTHMSPENDDGSHDCRISKGCLDAGRAALSKSGEKP